MSDRVLDASAVLAMLHRERGADLVAQAVSDGASISAVNLSEVIAKLADRSMPANEIREALVPLGLDVASFDADEAFAAGLLRPSTRARGLSFGDRACLALGLRTGLPVLTADRHWADLKIDGIEIELIR